MAHFDALKGWLACASSDAPWICDWRTTAAFAHLGLGGAG